MDGVDVDAGAVVVVVDNEIKGIDEDDVEEDNINGEADDVIIDFLVSDVGSEGGRRAPRIEVGVTNDDSKTGEEVQAVVLETH